MAHLQFGEMSSGYATLHLRKNGGGTVGNNLIMERGVSGFVIYMTFISPIIKVSQGDYLEIYATQTSGQSISVSLNNLCLEVLE